MGHQIHPTWRSRRPEITQRYLDTTLPMLERRYTGHTMLDILDELDDSTYYYLGGAEGSGFLYIGTGAEVKTKIAKVLREEQRAVADNRQPSESHISWMEFLHHDIVMVYRHTTKPEGVTLLADGAYKGRYWMYSELKHH